MKNTPDIYRDLMSFQRRMERMFDELLGGQLPALGTPAFQPSCDIEETDSAYLMSFDLPGVKKDDIRIDLREGALTVSGERKEEREQKDKSRFRSERFYGSFQRSFQLPSGVSPEQVQAHYEDGVLRIAVPKAQAAQSQQIRIGEGKPGIWDKLIGRKKEEIKAPDAGKRPSDKVA